MKLIRQTRIVALILALCMVLCCFSGYSKVAAKEACKKVEGNDYLITIAEQSSWNSGSVAEVRIKNTSDKAIRNWGVSLSLTSGKVINCWNTDATNKDNRYEFRCHNDNREIKSEEEIAFGYQLSGADISNVTDVKLVKYSTENNKSEDYSINHRIVNQWDNKATIETVITNNTDRTLEDWEISFSFDAKIYNIWNAKVKSVDADIITIQNADYNAEIKAGQSVNFGYQVEFPDEVVTCPTAEKLKSVSGAADSDAETTAKPSEKETYMPEMFATDAPVVTNQPEIITPQPTEEPEIETEDDEDEEESEDSEDIVPIYDDVENIDWNMDMINKTTDVVNEEISNPQARIKVAILDSGVDYSDEVNVVERKDFLNEYEEGEEDETSEVFNDVTGHGTAIAEILASNPKDKPMYFSKDEIGEEAEDVSDFFDEDKLEKDDAEKLTDEEINEMIAEDEESLADDEYTLADLADSGYEWTEGINPGMELYSARVLDENNETTVDRVVQAIDWAIEKDVNIINMSFGIKDNSSKLHTAIKKAYDQGILIISSAANEGTKEYPAAYKEVMAVGAVDAECKVSEEAPDNNGVEVVAPGDFIVSRGSFGLREVFSGTSLAVPHVVGLASLIWQKDTTKSADFVRELIKATAKECGNEKLYGEGLIDCSFALESYDEFSKSYRKHDEFEGENDEEPEVDEDISKISGSWNWKVHRGYISRNKHIKTKGFDRISLNALMKGATCSDTKKNTGLCGMKNHPWFHGFYAYMPKGTNINQESNYMIAYKYMYRLAVQQSKGVSPKKYLSGFDLPKIVGTTTEGEGKVIGGIYDAFAEGKVGSFSWKKILSEKGNKLKVTKTNKSLLLFGMAAHTVADTFAHSAYGHNKKAKKKHVIWNPLKHKKVGDKVLAGDADNTDVCKNRLTDSKKVVNALLNRIVIKGEKFNRFKDESGAFSVFLKPKYQSINDGIVSDIYGNVYVKAGFFKETYVLEKFDKYAKETGIFYKKYPKSRSIIQGMTYSYAKDKLKDFTFINVDFVAIKQVLGAMPKAVVTVRDSHTMQSLGENKLSSHDMSLCISKDSDLLLFITDKEAQKRGIIRYVNGTVITGGIGIVSDDKEKLYSGNIIDEVEEDEVICDYESTSFDLTDTKYRMEIEYNKSARDVNCMLVRFDKDNNMELCYNNVRQYTNDHLIVNEDGPDGMKYSSWYDGNLAKKSVETDYIDPENNYAFLVMSDISKEEYMDNKDDYQYICSESGVKVKLYRNDETTPVLEMEVPRQIGYSWEPFYIRGINGGIYVYDKISERVNCTIGGGEYYAK